MKPNRLAVSLALVLHAMPAAADDSALRAEFARVVQRLEQLEADNRRLQTRLADLEQHEQEEAMTSRLADLEFEVLTLRRQTRAIESVEGVSAAANLVMVAQGALPGDTATDDGALNYRADVAVTLPGGTVGDAAGHLFAQFRLGQGEGLAPASPGFSSTPNSTAFELGAGEDAAAILAQAWYQLDVPLAGANGEPGRHLELNFGKIDPFVFFDQNAIADDESTRFLNNALVHNPLLDSGGAAGVDAYGFTPGARLAYHADGTAGEWWRASLGVFGAGEGASFDGGFARPFVIAQVEAGDLHDGLPGTYRLYAWTNGSATPFANPAASTSERQSGWGVSIDRQLSPRVAAFARFGHAVEGHARFDYALTTGVELAGAAWAREGDRLGLAGGWLRASKAFRTAAPTLDADGVDGPDFGYAPDGAEWLAELYYAWRVNDHLELSPDLQWVGRPGADPAADDVVIAGLRATLGF
jgi:hypothetical protein